MKLLIILPIVLALFFFVPPTSDAHRDGCHRWHSCPSDSGSYVCGDLGYDNYCPTKSVKQPIKNVVPSEPIVDRDAVSPITKDSLKNSICKETHVQLLRHDNYLVCVFPSSADKLIERGWGLEIITDAIKPISNTTNEMTRSDCMANMAKGCSEYRGNANGYAICMSQAAQSCR